jgi:hypothetical protein
VVRQPLLTNYNHGTHHTTTYTYKHSLRWILPSCLVRLELRFGICVCAWLCLLGDGHLALDMSNVDEDAPLPFSTPRHVARVLAGTCMDICISYYMHIETINISGEKREGQCIGYQGCMEGGGCSRSADRLCLCASCYVMCDVGVCQVVWMGRVGRGRT